VGSGRITGKPEVNCKTTDRPSVRERHDWKDGAQEKIGEGLPSGANAYGALFSADGSAYAYGYVQTLSGGLGGEGIEVGQAYLEKHEMISSGVSPVVVP
jgi:hypothetical protein